MCDQYDNAIYTIKLDFIIKKTIVNAPKIDDLILVTYKMVLAYCSV